MLMTGNVATNKIVPFWNVIKKWDKDEKLKLIALISNSLVSEEMPEISAEEDFCSQLSPELMQGLAEFAVKEHRAGLCIPHDQVKESIMVRYVI